MGLHLMSNENDHVDTLEVRGFIVDDVPGGLQEAYAHSKATKCKKFLYSASFNPPKDAIFTDAQFIQTVDRAEKKLGLTNQPRVVVKHSKDGRNHVHCVWSRIDTDKMKAIPMDFDRDRLNALSRDLFLEHGWTMPDGFNDKQSRDPRTFNLAEWQQAQRHKLDAKQIKARIQHAWKISDDKASFANALAHEGFFLAKGDKKNVHVAVGWQGDIHAITRATGEESKAVKAKLGEPDTSITLEATNALIANAQSELHSRLQRELNLKHKADNRPLRAKKRELVQAQRTERQQQKTAHDKRQHLEQQQRQAQYQKGLRGLWRFITGKYHKQKQQHEAKYHAGLKRDAAEKQTLIEQQLAARQAMQTQLNTIKARQQQEAMKLNADFVKNLRGQALQGELKRKFNQSLSAQRTKPEVQQSPDISL